MTADETRQVADLYRAVVLALGQLGTVASAIDDAMTGPLVEAAPALDVARSATTVAWDALTWVRERVEGTA
jgi:hypothetical protein